MKSYTPKELMGELALYAAHSGWKITYFRFWKIVEFIYYLQTGKNVTGNTRSNRSESQKRIQALIDELVG